MNARVALVGGDEFRVGCEEMDRGILKTIGKSPPRVLVLPTAAASQNPVKSASNGVSYFRGLGAEASSLMVLGKDEANDSDFLAPINTTDLIYFAGGSPRHLLYTLSNSLLMEQLKTAAEGSAILAGSSAGAMVLGPWMHLRKWSKALGIIHGVAVMPHHERTNPDDITHELMCSAPHGLTVLGIDAMTCCFGGPEKWSVIGSGSVTVYEGERWSKHGPGELFTTPAATTSQEENKG